VPRGDRGTAAVPHEEDIGVLLEHREEPKTDRAVGPPCWCFFLRRASPSLSWFS
jgi:hypothetical protein